MQNRKKGISPFMDKIEKFLFDLSEETEGNTLNEGIPSSEEEISSNSPQDVSLKAHRLSKNEVLKENPLLQKNKFKES